VVVLSQEPYDVEDLAQVTRDIIDGDCSGSWSLGSDEKLTGPQMAKALEDQASDPAFFGLDEEGNDVNCPKCGNQYTEAELSQLVLDFCDDCEKEFQKFKCQTGDETKCEPCQIGQGACEHVKKAKASE
jgi:hypothetical protein